MLNYNKIHSSINFDRTSKRKLAEFMEIPASTLRSRLEQENLTPEDVEKIAEFFGKPIAYYFDKEEGYDKQPKELISKEPKHSYKSNTIDLLFAEKDKRIAVLEDMIAEMKENKEIVTERMEKQANMIEFLREKLVEVGHGEIAESSKLRSA